MSRWTTGSRRSGKRAGRGFGWALTGNLVYKLGSFAVSLVLVRLLAPHDFGLYAIALAANAFVIHVNDMGMIAATVQWRGEVADMAATATTMAIAFSVSWYALFYVAAPAFADLAGSPDATPLVRLLTLTIVVDGITAVSVGVIQRRFQQEALMKAIAVGFFFNALVSVTLAANGAGAYCFVVGALVQSLVVAALVLRIARMPFRLGFDRAVARRLITSEPRWRLRLASSRFSSTPTPWSSGTCWARSRWASTCWRSTSPAGCPDWSARPCGTSRFRPSHDWPRGRWATLPSACSAACL